MRDVLTNQTQEDLDALNCEADMMTALSRLFGEAYMRGRAQGRNEAATNATSATPAPVDAEGKTPGQVNFEAYETHLRASMTPGIDIRQLVMGAYDAGAKAVLRAFGNKPTIRDMSYDDMVRAFGQEGVGHIVGLALDKTGRKETADTSQRVREAVLVAFDEIDGPVEFHDTVARIIDAELAKPGQ